MFSIATISYNQAPFLEQCIRSVVDQLPEESEYFVMDGNSTDGSVETIKRYADQITFWQSCQDGGPAAALAAAVQRSTQPYFLYINSDDYLQPGGIHAIECEIQANPGYDVYYGHGYTLDNSSNLLTVRHSDNWNEELYARGMCSIVQQSTVLRTDAIRAAGNFPIENRTCWDGEILWRISRNQGAFCKVQTKLGVFRIHEESITGSGTNVQAYHADRQRMADEIGANFVSYEHMSQFQKVLARARDPWNSLERLGTYFQNRWPRNRK